MTDYILIIPDNYSEHYFGPFQSVEEAKEFLLKNYPKPIEKLGVRESRANPRNLLTVYFSNIFKNPYWEPGKPKDDFRPEFYDYPIASMYEINKEKCSMIMRDGH
jgi:hypothetical protein